MLTMLAWIPRIVQFFGLFRGVVGFVGPMWPRISSYLRRRQGGWSQAAAAF